MKYLHVDGENLPVELWRSILIHLELGSIFKSAQVCHTWRTVIRDDCDIFWENKLRTYFPMALPTAGSCYRQFFCGIWTGETILHVEILNFTCASGSFGSSVRRYVRLTLTQQDKISCGQLNFHICFCYCDRQDTIALTIGGTSSPSTTRTVSPVQSCSLLPACAACQNRRRGSGALSAAATLSPF